MLAASVAIAYWNARLIVYRFKESETEHKNILKYLILIKNPIQIRLVKLVNKLL